MNGTVTGIYAILETGSPEVIAVRHKLIAAVDVYINDPSEQSYALVLAERRAAHDAGMSEFEIGFWSNDTLIGKNDATA